MSDKKPTGICSVCSLRKTLTSSGAVRLHLQNGVTCAGACLPPRPPKERAPATSWAAVRRATFARDGDRCRKCGKDADLQAHHMLERVYGGPDTLENLITLCGHCHDEWTCAEPPAELMPFEVWLATPPARYLVAVWNMRWPEGVSAAQFKEEIAGMLAQVLRQGAETK